jgi:hypothetical protein
MHDTAAAGGYPLDSSRGAGGQQLDPTPRRATPGRTPRRPDPAETRRDHTPVAGPTLRSPAPSPGTTGRTTPSTDGAAAHPAAPRSRKDSYTYLKTGNGSPPFSRLRVAPGDSDQLEARGVGPHPQSTRLRAQAGRAPPPAQRRLAGGTCRSPSQPEGRTVETRHRRPNPGPPRHTRGQQDRGLRRAAPRPSATATRSTPIAQSGRAATRQRRPIPGRPRAWTSQPPRPAVQRHDDSELITATHRSRSVTRLRRRSAIGPLPSTDRTQDVPNPPRPRVTSSAHRRPAP